MTKPGANAVNLDVAQHDPDWWRGAVIYQIYPRSYCDSDGDGIGDLAGITGKLDYIAGLGVDAIWISPFCKSPMKDFGYDVSDYRDIDPMFGNLADFDDLINGAHQRGIRIIMDLVLSHTSDQHPWFVESRSSHDNPYHDWYVWADASADGTAPNNWLSIFGGPAWTWDTTRQQYYMHNFLTSQPDLNFHSEAVQDALLEVAAFWLDRGVDGFRLDTINFYFCDRHLRSNPPLPAELRNADIAPAVNPYNHQSHLYDKSQPENIAFLERFRALLDQYPAATAVGELGDSERGMSLLAEYTRGDSRVHMCYTFDFLSENLPTASHSASLLRQFQALGEDNWVCWAFSNHDVRRFATRWQPGVLADGTRADQHLRLFASMLLSFHGSICLYQGEELGLTEANVPRELLQDPYGIKFWPEFKGRDGCRTPMVWDETLAHAGFSTETPWLPVDLDHIPLSVNRQDKDPHSLLNHYRASISFRNQHEALVKGPLTSISDSQDVLMLYRDGAQPILCIFNPDSASRDIVLTGSPRLLPAPGFSPRLEQGLLTLPGWHAAFVIGTEAPVDGDSA